MAFTLSLVSNCVGFFVFVFVFFPVFNTNVRANVDDADDGYFC